MKKRIRIEEKEYTSRKRKTIIEVDMTNLILAATLGDKIDSTFYAFDMAVYDIFAPLHSSFMNKVAMAFTSFGDEKFTICVVLLAVVLCLFKKTRKYGIALGAAAVIGTGITNVIAKPLILRIRPYNTLQNVKEYWDCYISAGAFSESDYSFPSGHTTGAFELAVASSICLRKDGRKVLSIVPVVIAAFTALSRIYLCVHYPTDVISATIIGIFAGIVGYFIACALVKMIEKSPIDKIDLGEKIHIKGKGAAAAIVIYLFAAFAFAFGVQFFEGGDAKRCAYSNDTFTCYNEAKTDDKKYPAIDGKEYCKIHWKEIMGEGND